MTTNQTTAAPSLPRIAVYITAVLGLGWLGPLIDRTFGHGIGEGPGQLLWILLPVGAAALLRWRGGDGFADAGLRPRYRRNRRWYEFSSAFYPVVMLIAAAGGLAANHWDLHDDSAPLRFAAIAVIALLPFTLAAIAEEFGWRGYLTPRLHAAGVGRLTNHVTVGVIWGAWHLPYMTVAWDFTDESLWTLAPRVILGTTLAAVVYGEIRLRTGTVWPAVVMHAASNAIAFGLLNDNVLVQNEATPWIFAPGIDSAAVITLTALVGVLLFTHQPTNNRTNRHLGSSAQHAAARGRRHSRPERVAGMTRRSKLVLAGTAIALIATACGSAVQTTSGNTAAEPMDSTVSVANSGTETVTFDPVTDTTFALPDGWFEMAGYGTVLHVGGEDVIPHFVTSSTCVVGESFDNDLQVDHASADGVITLDLVGPTTDYRLLPLAGPLSCDTEVDETVTALDELFTTHYPFFDQRNFDWSTAIAELRLEVEAAPDALENTLAEIMVALGDGHTTLDNLDIDPSIDAFDLAGVTTIEQLEHAIGEEFDSTLARIADATVDETGSVAWGKLNDATSYVIMAAFEGISGDDDPVADREALRAALDAAMIDLADSDHLVVDVRFNGGGYEDLAVLAAGYFVEETTPAYRKWAHAQPDPFVQTVDVKPQNSFFDGDISILTSPITASAAEVFTLAMVEVAGATVVGNPSFGEFSDAMDWTLPDGTELTISMENYTNLAGNNREVTGIPVDVEVPFDEAIEAAINHAGGGQNN